MNRKLIVTLLRKDIQELDMITQGFMEMTVYPKAIILLAQRKTADIQSYIQQLSIESLAVDEIKLISELEEKSQVLENHEVIDDLGESENIKITEPTEDTELTEFNNADKVDEETELIISIEKDEVTVEIEVDNDVYVSEIIEVESDVEDKDLVKDSVEKEVINDKEVTDDELVSELNIEITVEETRKTILGERSFSTTHTRNELLSKDDNSISSNLANKKITDIKQAINIGDRFRFQRELFRGNGEDMNKTLTYLNQLATLVEAESFLQSKYGWSSESEAVEDFYQIVRRRFL